MTQITIASKDGQNLVAMLLKHRQADLDCFVNFLNESFAFESDADREWFRQWGKAFGGNLQQLDKAILGVLSAKTLEEAQEVVASYHTFQASYTA